MTFTSTFPELHVDQAKTLNLKGVCTCPCARAVSRHRTLWQVKNLHFLEFLKLPSERVVSWQQSDECSGSQKLSGVGSKACSICQHKQSGALLRGSLVANFLS